MRTKKKVKEFEKTFFFLFHSMKLKVQHHMHACMLYKNFSFKTAENNIVCDSGVDNRYVPIT